MTEREQIVVIIQEALPVFSRINDLYNQAAVIDTTPYEKQLDLISDKVEAIVNENLDLINNIGRDYRYYDAVAFFDKLRPAPLLVEVQVFCFARVLIAKKKIAAKI